ncbi:hypothetical protein C8R44DRAFT_309170 [Mycena epipterygia]|nr:hypothetical protein C8R44DRAFT_309170 [Mycena epipterygia]
MGHDSGSGARFRAGVRLEVKQGYDKREGVRCDKPVVKGIYRWGGRKKSWVTREGPLRRSVCRVCVPSDQPCLFIVKIFRGCPLRCAVCRVYLPLGLAGIGE